MVHIGPLGILLVLQAPNGRRAQVFFSAPRGFDESCLAQDAGTAILHLISVNPDVFGLPPPSSLVDVTCVSNRTVGALRTGHCFIGGP